MTRKRSPRYREGTNLKQSRIPADQKIQQQANIAAAGLVNKSPTIESAVITSFDARPINAYDFIISRTVDKEPGAYTNFSVSYTVPSGIISLLRGFKYTLLPAFAGVIDSEITGKIDVNGITSSGMEAFNLGQSISNYQPCYVLANSGDIVTFTLTFTGLYLLIATKAGMQVTFYGNNLLATGKPLSYEPGFTNSVPVHTTT